MKSNIVRSALVSIVIILIGYVLIQQNSQTNETQTIETGDMRSTQTTTMNHDMHDMMVQSEQAFITGMIPHHQEAVDTAKEVLARGATTPEIRTLAENIITAQEQEIAMMKSWHEAWYGEAYEADDSYTPMMRPLGALSGVELDKTFLEDMIMHHMGAIMMAHSVKPYVEHDELNVLTNAVIETQSAEIEAMRRMIEGL